MNDLCEAFSDAMIRQTLQDLPGGLVQTYERILLKISKSSSAKQVLALRMFSWTICARRPMKTEELQEAVAFEDSDRSWDREKIPDANLMIETCRGLLVRDQEDGTVRFAHYTVQHYLLTAPSIESRQHFHVPPFRVSPRSEAEAFVGQVCVTYLCFSDFETQIARRTPSGKHEHLNINKIGGPVRIPTALGIGKALTEISYRWFGGKPTKSIDYSKYLTTIPNPRPQVPSDLVKKHRLLDYIVDYWMEHTQEMELGKKFLHLVMHKTLSFEFRPWGLNQHFGPYGCTSCPDTSKARELPFTSLFHYAAQVGHWSLMEPLVAEYCQHEVPIYETLLIACSQGQDGIVRKLTGMIDFDLSDGHAVNAAVAAGHAKVLQSLSELNRNPLLLHRKSSLYDFTENTLSLLILAATNGHEEVMECILAIPEDIVPKYQNLDLKDEATGCTALSAAVVNGHEHIVRNLLDKGARIQGHGTTAAHFAAEYGHQDILRMLIQELSLYYPSKDFQGIINLKNTDGYTLLYLAARGGHVDALKILIDQKASLEADTYDQGWTPLHCAAALGHQAVIQLLLKSGAKPRTEAKDGSTALKLASKGGHDGAVQAILRGYPSL